MKFMSFALTFSLAQAVTFAADSALDAGGSFTPSGNGSRGYLRTARTDCARESFQAEITVTLKGGGGNGCAFFGLGRGEADAGNFGEPSVAPAVYLRLAPSDFAGGCTVASAGGENVAGGAVGDGTHRIRLTWDAEKMRALFEVAARWNGKAFRPTTAIAIDCAKLDFSKGACLFAGGADRVTFSGFASKPLTAAELKAVKFVSSAGSTAACGWLPAENQTDRTDQSDLSDLLKPLAASVRPLACQYNGSKLVTATPFANGAAEAEGAKWSYDLRKSTASDASDLTFTFKLAAGSAEQAGAAVAFDFAKWDKKNYVLIPASVYSGNRLRTVGRGYCAGLDNADYYRKDLPLTQGEMPRLQIEDGKPSKLEVNACNVTTPAVCIFDKAKKRGFILLAEQAARGGNGDFLRKENGEIQDNAFAVEENLDRTRATVVVGAPGVRERKPEFIGFGGSPDRGMALKAGDTITLKLRVYCFKTPDIPGLLEKFMAVRKALTGPNHPRNLVPASQVEKYMTGIIDGRFLSNKNAQFYCPENGDWIAFGWIGGWMNTFPMLVQGDAMHLDRVSKTFDFGFRAQEPSGYLRYAIRQDGNVTFREPKPDMNQSRTLGDVLYWMIKQFNLLKAQGRGDAVKPEWEAGIKKLADAFVATWKQDGQWGKMVNVKTGAVSEYNTTGGAPVIGGLAYASVYFNNPEYLKVAKEAANFYYQRDFVKQGFTTGGCADILQNADSETASALCCSLMALYEVTDDTAWLEKCRQVANLVATWTVSYDYELPKFTELGGLGAKLAGVVCASTQNKHGAPGICTNSGDYLFKLYRATGDTLCADLIRDIVRAHGESIRSDGRTNERLTYCDADSRGSRGGQVTGWNETNGILMAQELPGIYLQTDSDRFYVFDSVEAKRTGNTITITNPTKFNAAVSIFAESAADSAKPQGVTALLKWPKVEIKAGETKTVTVGKEGKIQ